MLQILESTFEEKEPSSYFSLCAVLCLVSHWCSTLWDPMDYSPPGSSVHGDSLARILEWVAMSSSRGSSQPRDQTGLPHCRRILYHLSHQGSPWMLEWVAYPFSRGSSWPRNQTGVSYNAGRFFASWATRGAHFSPYIEPNFSRVSTLVSISLFPIPSSIHSPLPE